MGLLSFYHSKWIVEQSAQGTESSEEIHIPRNIPLTDLGGVGKRKRPNSCAQDIW